MTISGRASGTGHAGSTAAGRSRRPGIAGVCALMAVAATAGAIGLAGGGIDMGPDISRRLPLHSPVLGGLALLAVVAAPMTVAAVAAWRGIARAPLVVILAGLALVGWIIAEVAFIRTFSWLQPVCAAYGALVAVLGWRARR